MIPQPHQNKKNMFWVTVVVSDISWHNHFQNHKTTGLSVAIMFENKFFIGQNKNVLTQPKISSFKMPV